METLVDFISGQRMSRVLVWSSKNLPSTLADRNSLWSLIITPMLTFATAEEYDAQQQKFGSDPDPVRFFIQDPDPSMQIFSDPDPLSSKNSIRPIPSTYHDITLTKSGYGQFAPTASVLIFSSKSILFQLISAIRLENLGSHYIASHMFDDFWLWFYANPLANNETSRENPPCFCVPTSIKTPDPDASSIGFIPSKNGLVLRNACDNDDRNSDNKCGCRTNCHKS
uniref:Uncharacterized protein n=1 Tax=Romanomermis culicivorax TaxID=13658 RepID=A0A915HR20_ROMCU